MSASRSVAAAQRRRAGPPEVQTPRGPNTSINSSQAFSQPPQMRPGTTGRLAGQQAALNQQQQMQQQAQTQNSSPSQSKMTVPKAITLITLRLGRLETQMQNLDMSALGQYNENGELQQTDSAVITNILQRLDALEQKSNELSVVKQQLDVFKPALVTIKNASIGNAKEVKTLKENVEQMKQELHLTQALVTDLQGLLGAENNNTEEENQAMDSEDVTEITDTEQLDDVNTSSIVNLKDIIEQELNSSEL